MVFLRSRLVSEGTALPKNGRLTDDEIRDDQNDEDDADNQQNFRRLLYSDRFSTLGENKTSLKAFHINSCSD